MSLFFSEGEAFEEALKALKSQVSPELQNLEVLVGVPESKAVSALTRVLDLADQTPSPSPSQKSKPGL